MPGDAGAQQQRQQLGVAQRGGAAGQQLFARAGVGGQVFEGHGGSLGDRGAAEAAAPYNGGQFIGTPTLALPLRSSRARRRPAGLLPHAALPAGRPGGDIINTFDDKPATLSLGTGELSPAVEQRLLGLEEGARATFELPAGEAFGERNPEMLQWVARSAARRRWATRTRTTASATWCSSRRPTARGSYAGAVREVEATTAPCCSTSTIRWPASRVTFEVHVIGVL